jgi:hypothetical protein
MRQAQILKVLLLVLLFFISSKTKAPAKALLKSELASSL